MENLFLKLLQMSVPASYLILAVLFVRFLLRKAPKSMRSFLWLLVGIRLTVPFSVESVFSLVPSTQSVSGYIYDTVQPDINTGLNTSGVTNLVNEASPNSMTSYAEKQMSKTQTAVWFATRVWLAGMALMLGYMLVSWLRLKARVKMSVPEIVTLDCGGTKISRKIYQSDVVGSPFLFGIIRPRIYIPNCVANEELPYVVWHEMTHLGRRDYLIKPAGFLLLSVYWFNPFVWAAYIMLCKDIELICDEKVIRQLGASCKKAYSQALLNNASNRRMIAACPVAFGEVSVKTRVKNVLNYKKPAFWVLVAAVSACIIVPICFMTQKKTGTANDTALKDTAEMPSEDYCIDDLFAMTGDYEMLNPDQYPHTPQLSLNKDGTFSFSYSAVSSYWPYGTYEQKDNILTAVTDDGKYYYQFTCVGDVNNSLLFFDTEHSSDVTDIDEKLKADAPIRDGSIFVKNILSQTLSDAQELSQAFQQTLSLGTTMTVEELQNQQGTFMEIYEQLTIGEMKVQWQLEKAKELQLTQEDADALEVRLQEWIQAAQSALRQLEEDMNTCQTMLHAAENTDLQAAYEVVEQWARAFCNRDGGAIVKLADDKAEQELVDRNLLLQGFDGEKDYVAFGWSSPWPWGDNDNNYRIINVTDRYAEILYYAWVSNPHVTVWREQLTFKMENDKYVITSETLQFMDSICTAGEFQQAYPDGISGTMMDYVSYNGAGVDLNRHAISNRADWWYGKLLEPDSAAVTLLNILDNPNKVGVHVENVDTNGDIRTVTFEFYEDGSSVSVQMLRPYGSDGIWVPYTQPSSTVHTREHVSSVSPNMITRQNVTDIIAEDTKLLEALFPEHHESIPNVSFPYMIDLNGDGVEEKLDFTDLRYNGGDGGYALTVTDTKTGKKIPLPDGYTEESGFPIRTFYMQQGEEAQLMVQLGEEKNCQIAAAIMQDALYEIYERRGMYAEFKRTLPDQSGQIAAADALSGCNIYYFNNEENPVILLKTYVSGFLGHIDTLGYIITELRLQKDNTWTSKHYFLLDSCHDTTVTQTESGSVPVPSGNDQ